MNRQIRMTVDVVVPMHGGWDMVQQCLASLRGQTVDCNVVVVDDASPDDSADRVSAEFPDVHLVKCSSNVGFAKAANTGMRHGSGEIVVVLNSDVVPTPDFIEELVTVFVDQRVGSATGVLFGLDGCVDAVGVSIDPTLAGFVRYHGAERWSANSPAVGSAYGAAAAYRRTALEQVGLFDENLFMYGEELELGLRLLSAGWIPRVATAATATHVGGGSIGAGSRRQRYLAAFGRGYTLHVYDVVRGIQGVRALTTEALVVALRVLRSHDFVAASGRVDGWRAAKGVPKRTRPSIGIEHRITFVESLRMRRPSYWRGREKKWHHES